MLSYRTIESHTLELLKALQSNEAIKQTRLVGGTALALQYGHRSSIDLDLFGHIDIEIGTPSKHTSKSIFRDIKHKSSKGQPFEDLCLIEVHYRLIGISPG